MEELEGIIGGCNCNKSPGLDGLCYEFYQETYSIIKNDLLQILQCQLDRGKIIESNKDGVTRLAPKVKGVPSVDELRPITLLNCDYKILSQWLVKRMKPVLPYVIRSGQLCIVGKNKPDKGRPKCFGTCPISCSIFRCVCISRIHVVTY